MVFEYPEALVQKLRKSGISIVDTRISSDGDDLEIFLYRPTYAIAVISEGEMEEVKESVDAFKELAIERIEEAAADLAPEDA